MDGGFMIRLSFALNTGALFSICCPECERATGGPKTSIRKLLIKGIPRRPGDVQSKRCVEMLTRCRNFDSTLNEVRNIYWGIGAGRNTGRQCQLITSARVQLVPTKELRWSYSTGPRQKQTAVQFLYRRGDSHGARST